MVGRTVLRLRPAQEEGQTRFLLLGSLPDALPPVVLHQLLSLLTYWSGEPIEVVLSAVAPAGWLEPWIDALADVPERRLHVRFRASEDLFSE